MIDFIALGVRIGGHCEVSSKTLKWRDCDILTLKPT
jgi:hypothetical protein